MAWREANEGSNWLEEFEWGGPSEASSTNWMDEYLTSLDTASARRFRTYQFREAASNPYVHLAEEMDVRGIGRALLEEGKLSEAILALEAALQRDLTMEESSECWQLLGQAQAENDEDAQAIAALENAVKATPENREARMSLAVSYTNDLFREEALETLRLWLEQHPGYRDLPPGPTEGLSFEERHAVLSGRFLAAARERPSGDLDAEVQTALGLLYNLSMEYTRAADCFQAALSVRPDDPCLWNKLGATLANGGRNADAIPCYIRALALRPSYVRARANLAISFLALHELRRAAEFFLAALAMRPDALHLWANLQTTFQSMERPDLAERCSENNVDFFRDEFDF